MNSREMWIGVKTDSDGGKTAHEGMLTDTVNHEAGMKTRGGLEGASWNTGEIE